MIIIYPITDNSCGISTIKKTGFKWGIVIRCKRTGGGVMGISSVTANKISQFVDPSRRMAKPLTEIKPEQSEKPQSFQETFRTALDHPEGKGLFVDSAL